MIGLAAAKRVSFGSVGLAFQNVSGESDGSYRYFDESSAAGGSFTIPSGKRSSRVITAGVTLPTGTLVALTRGTGEVERTFLRSFSMNADLMTDTHETKTSIRRVEQELWGHRVAAEYANATGSGVGLVEGYNWDGTDRLRDPGTDSSWDSSIASPRWGMSISRMLSEETKLTAGFSRAAEKLTDSRNDTADSYLYRGVLERNTKLYSGRVDHRFSDRLRAAVGLGYRVTKCVLENTNTDYSVTPNVPRIFTKYWGPYRTVDASAEVEYQLAGGWAITAEAFHSTVFHVDVAQLGYIGDQTELTVGAKLTF